MDNNRDVEKLVQELSMRAGLTEEDREYVNGINRELEGIFNRFGSNPGVRFYTPVNHTPIDLKRLDYHQLLVVDGIINSRIEPSWLDRRVTSLYEKVRGFPSPFGIATEFADDPEVREILDRQEMPYALLARIETYDRDNKADGLNCKIDNKPLLVVPDLSPENLKTLRKAEKRLFFSQIERRLFGILPIRKPLKKAS
ncbi:MAG: hypothetical protein AABW89_03050 [Nanoarchaeota archaeon]